ncbi:ImmA/IrrE family metallo-endopeptidase [Falsiporphyromonas endometrii]|uniref:ImmA/IrrE family metallo-endopeptidase n=1 Tax=Falsiporphyromonas endometrii TaxID=1387297 RepID=A0ABV9K6K3_9PORP
MLNLKHLYKHLHCPFTTVIDRVKWIKNLFPFDLLTIEEQKLQVAGLYKHSEKVEIDEKNMLTWLVLNWLAISQISAINSYKQGNALKAAQEIATMANQRRMNINLIKQCLQNYGISLVEVKKLDKAPIDAYSTIANGYPTITVTYRYNDMDKLAFDILHELCHIDRHLSDTQKAFISIEGTEYSKDPREKEANEFAKNALIPEDIWTKILKVGCKSLYPYKIVKTIAKEAEKFGISPSIAVSRYKHDTNWYKISAYRSPKIFE